MSSRCPPRNVSIVVMCNYARSSSTRCNTSGLSPNLGFRIPHLDRSLVPHRQDHMCRSSLLLSSSEGIGHPGWGVARHHGELLVLLVDLLQSLLRLHSTRRLPAMAQSARDPSRFGRDILELVRQRLPSLLRGHLCLLISYTQDG